MKSESSLIQRLMSLNAELFATGESEAAFHTLMAALHAAERRRDMAALDEIGAAGKSQGEQIDALQPEHKLSRLQAEQRGQVPVYHTLQLHVDAVRLRVQSREALDPRP
jgi:hypothetical protein